MTKVLSFASKTKSCFLSKFHQYSMKKEERGLNQHSTGSSLCIFCPRSFCRKISSDCYNQSIQLDVVTFRLEFLQGCSLFAKRATEDKILDYSKTHTNYFQKLKPKAKQKGNSVLRGGQRYRVLMKGRLRGVILRVLTFHSHDNLPTKSNFGLTFLAFWSDSRECSQPSRSSLSLVGIPMDTTANNLNREKLGED